MGIGPYPTISLADARQRAAEYRRQRHDGMDPLEARKTERQAQLVAAAKGRTFRECAVEYIASHRAGWRSAKHNNQWESTLERFAYPVIGELPVAAIDTSLVTRVLEPIWNTKLETASRLRGRIEAVLDAAAARGYRGGPNPAQWKGNLAHLLPPPAKVRRTTHYAALPIDEVPGFMAELRKREVIASRALEFAILTAARTNEVIGARWDEIDLAAKTWTVPAERMKAGKEQRVPLCEAALKVLDAVRPLALLHHGKPAANSQVFPGLRPALPMDSSTLLKLLERMGHGDITTHGFRSSFRDWAAERTNYPRDVIEMALAHAIESKVEAAYRRGDLFEKRRQLMEAWGRFCTTPEKIGEVVPLHAAQ
jgi:integrase